MTKRRFLAPEAVQASAMDCGPACLKAALEGFGIPSSYDRLREVCQTEVDGTSIDAIEEAANDLGLEAEQIMLPADHLPPEAAALPAIVVVRLPNGFTHFVVVWRRFGRRLQIMDPAEGRQWHDATKFLERVHVHQQIVPAAAWREWAGSPEFTGALRSRSRRLRIADDAISQALETALADTGWLRLAALDATLRMIHPIAEGTRAESRTCTRMFAQFLEEAWTAGNPFAVVAPVHWSALPVAGTAGEEQQLAFRGAVVLRFRGARPDREAGRSGDTAATLSDAVRGRPAPAWSGIVGFLREDGLLTPAALAFGMALGAAGVFSEALLYRVFVDLPTMLGIGAQRLGTLAMLTGFVACLLLLDVLNARGLLAMGRKLEARVRAHLFHATPRLKDRYFGSRLISDMAERSHAIHEIRAAPMLGAQFVRSIVALVLTLCGIAWLDPQSPWPGMVCAVVALGLPLAAEPLLSERDLRFRSHSGALCRYYLDALRGLTPARAHVSEEAIQCEHEDLLVRWAKSGLDRQRVAVALTTVGALVNVGLIAWVIVGHIARHGGSAVVLLLVYWALNIPMLCGQIALLTWQYPKQKNLARRLLDPLQGADDTEDPSPAPARPAAEGVSIAFEDVSVRAIGQTILDNCTLEMRAGSHVCVVGASGAGKSTFVSLLLGWHSPSTGRILVDGQPLDAAGLEALRSRTAWVDPGVQLWNRSLLDNLHYGATPAEAAMSPGRVVEQADLLPVIQSLPDGMQTRLGESGALVSGGEGQRVRLGRAMLRNAPRLVILDEPFTHLDRGGRETLLRRARELWRDATLICITHDVREALGFDRVLVFDRGRVVEDGIPSELASVKGTRFARLLRAEAVLRKRVWAGRWWRKVRLAKGQIQESSRAGTYDEPITGDLLAGGAVGRSVGGALPHRQARFEDGEFDPDAGVAAGRRSRVG